MALATSTSDSEFTRAGGELSQDSNRLTEAAGALLDAARGLAAVIDAEVAPRSASAIRELVGATAELFLDASEGS